MGGWTIGQLIASERNLQSLQGKILIEGIGTKQSLQELEDDRLQGNKLLVDILLQRLGRSPDKLEYILSWSEYRLECIRDWFEECVFKGKKKWAQKALYLYEKKTLKIGAVQRMYLYRGRAMIAYWIDGAVSEAEEWLAEALNATFPRWRQPVWKNCRISTMEMENALALARVWQEQGKQDDALLERCGAYIREYVTDGEENAKIYSKYAWLAAKQEGQAGNWKGALELCEEALGRLRRYSIEYFSSPLLCSILAYQEQLQKNGTRRDAWQAAGTDSADDGKERNMDCAVAEAASALEGGRKERYYKECLDALRHLKEQFEEGWYPQDSVTYNCCQKAYHLDFEILRAERYARGMTQEEVMDGVYENPKEIARIENRKSSPRSRRFNRLMGNLGMEKERMSGLVATDSFQVLELRKQIQGLFSRQEYNAVKPLVRELEKKLDMYYAENRRAIRWIQNTIDISEGNRSYESVLEEDWKMLGETYSLSPERLQKSPEIKTRKGRVQTYRAPMRNEAELINQIAILLKKLGRRDVAIKLYEWVLKTFEKSAVKPKYRYHSYVLLQENLAAYQCSIEGGKEALRCALACGKAGVLGNLYLTLACAMEDDSANREVCRRMIREVYYLFEFTNDYVNQGVVRRYYRENYGEELEKELEKELMRP